MRTSIALGLAAVLLLVPAVSRADDALAWPQFRGPLGSGIAADDQNPPVELGPERNVKWKIPAPPGLSSPIVAGDRLILTAFEDGKLYTVAYSRADGRELWRKHAPAEKLEPFHKVEGSPAASTPATDGSRIVSYFGSCGVFCYDLDGKELWKFPLPPASLAGEFGSGVSPIISDGLVILVRDQLQDARIYVLDAVTGELKWERPRQSPAAYTTPVIWRTQAGPQIAVAGHVRMIGYDLRTGAEKWSVAGLPSGCCSSPVIAGGTLLFAGSTGGSDNPEENQMPSYDTMLQMLDTDKDGSLSRAEAEKAFEGFFDTQDANKDGQVSRDEWDIIVRFLSEGKSSVFALKSGGAGDITASHTLWKHTKGLPYVASGIAYQGQYVTVKDGGIVTARDLVTGDQLYMKRAAAEGKYYASPVAAAGHIYFTSLDGTITVVRAGTNDPAVVAENPTLDERTSASPAIAGSSLFVRTDKHLYAFAADN